MTFKKVQAKVKLCRTLKMTSIFLVAAGIMVFVNMLRGFAFTPDTLMLGAMGYVMSMAGSLGILYSLKFTKEHTVCPKCGRQIHVLDFIYMKNFKCTHCEYECDADEAIW